MSRLDTGSSFRGGSSRGMKSQEIWVEPRKTFAVPSSQSFNPKSVNVGVVPRSRGNAEIEESIMDSKGAGELEVDVCGLIRLGYTTG